MPVAGFSSSGIRARWLPMLVFALLLAPLTAHALEPSELLKDPALEERARHISAELRCLVCQNQSIDDSDAPLARDLRQLVRERLVAGDTDAEVRSFLVARYGEFVLLKPPLSLHTLLLWGTPLMTLLAVAFVLWRSYGRQHAPRKDDQLTADEQRRLNELME